MVRGDKGKYTQKQQRQAEKIAAGYIERGLDPKESKRRAWATVNKTTQGGKLPGGSGRGKQQVHASPAKRGKKGAAAAGRMARKQPASPGKTARTGRRRAAAAKS